MSRFGDRRSSWLPAARQRVADPLIDVAAADEKLPPFLLRI